MTRVGALVLCLALALPAGAADDYQPAFVEVSERSSLGFSLSLYNRCEQVKPFKRVSGEDPRWPQTPGVPLDVVVRVRCVVLKDGSVRQCRMTGSPRLEDVVLGAVGKWKFEPYRRHGEPAPVTYLFTLHSKPGSRVGRDEFTAAGDGLWGSGGCHLDSKPVGTNVPAMRWPLEPPDRR